MFFWLVLHSLQLSGAEAAEAGFNGEKWTSSCLISTPPNSMKFNMCQYFGESREEPRSGPEGSHQGPRRSPLGRAEYPPGPLVPLQGGALWPILPPRGRNPKKRGVSEFRRCLVAKTYREEK